MKIFKKKVLIAVLIIVVLFLIYFVGTGFVKNTSVYISDFSVSEDGKEITINVGIASSMGYIRDVSIHRQEDGKLYFNCYSAFGGLNGSIGAKNDFTLPLDKNTSIIAIYRNSNCYEEVLFKGKDGSWQRVKTVTNCLAICLLARILTHW